MNMRQRIEWLKTDQDSKHTEAQAGKPERWTNWQASDYGGDCCGLWGTALPWQQLDAWADASFFGIFTNNKDLQVVMCCEGDWSLVQCSDEAAYNQRIDELCEFHEPGQILTAIGPGGSETMTQDRGCHYSPPRDGAATAGDQIRAAFSDALGGSTNE